MILLSIYKKAMPLTLVTYNKLEKCNLVASLYLILRDQVLYDIPYNSMQMVFICGEAIFLKGHAQV